MELHVSYAIIFKDNCVPESEVFHGKRMVTSPPILAPNILVIISCLPEFGIRIFPIQLLASGERKVKARRETVLQVPPATRKLLVSAVRYNHAAMSLGMSAEEDSGRQTNAEVEFIPSTVLSRFEGPNLALMLIQWISSMVLIRAHSSGSAESASTGICQSPAKNCRRWNLIPALTRSR
ncbi:hypothetical protein F5877DRAFT_73472 [Lentinula edodes]|nr:hypothetical protein F5877DRAFT_73472 [Lentinula edodes]